MNFLCLTHADGELYYGLRKAVKTKENCRALFKEFHSTLLGGHSGVFKTRNSSARYYWPGMSVDLEQWVQNTPIQKTQGVTEWFKYDNHMLRPSQAPDLNQTEHPWEKGREGRAAFVCVFSISFLKLKTHNHAWEHESSSLSAFEHI